MPHRTPVNYFSTEAKILFWPSFVDMLITTLMSVILVYFLQTVFNVGNLEALKIEKHQDEFVQNFDRTFAVEKGKKQIDIKRSLNLIRIIFNNEILFQSGEYQLQPQGRLMLERIADLFKTSNTRNIRQIQVEGHTDDRRVERRGAYPGDNWELSAARSISVVKYLTEEQHLYSRVDPSVFISANGYGEFKPVAENKTEEGRAKNRRIEILIFFSTPEGGKN
jgi:flagellar motor protein MotB